MQPGDRWSHFVHVDNLLNGDYSLLIFVCWSKKDDQMNYGDGL